MREQPSPRGHLLFRAAVAVDWVGYLVGFILADGDRTVGYILGLGSAALVALVVMPIVLLRHFAKGHRWPAWLVIVFGVLGATSQIGGGSSRLLVAGLALVAALLAVAALRAGRTTAP